MRSLSRASCQGSLKNQQVPIDLDWFEMIKKNENNIRIRRYIDGGTVLVLTSLFYVPKGEDDIRLVYDLTTSEMNYALWDPTFWIPLAGNFLDVATHLSWFENIY